MILQATMTKKQKAEVKKEDHCEPGVEEDEAGPAEGGDLEERLERNREWCIAILDCSRKSQRKFSQQQKQRLAMMIL